MSNPYGNDPYGQQPPNPYGGGGGSSFPAPGVGGFEQPKTDGVAIAALVTSLICCAPVAVVLGFIGLGRTKGGQRKGRGMAITGIVLGLLGLLVWVGVGILAAVGVDFLDDVRTIDDLEKGQCINASGLKANEDSSVGIITEVDCAKSHDGQVIATKTLTADEADAYDFGNEDQISENCGSMIDPSLAATLLDPKYYLLALTESKTPDEGDHVVCVISLANGDDLTEDLL